MKLTSDSYVVRLALTLVGMSGKKVDVTLPFDERELRAFRSELLCLQREKEEEEKRLQRVPYTLRQRLDAVKLYLKAKEHDIPAAAEFHFKYSDVNYSTFFKWLEEYRDAEPEDYTQEELDKKRRR